MNLYQYLLFSAPTLEERMIPIESEFHTGINNRAEVAKLRKRLKPGNGMEVDRGVLRHYGIYIGDDLVIELNGVTQGKNKSRVVKLADFLVSCKSDSVRVIESKKYEPEKVIERAKLALMAKKIPYSLTKNNCEHFMNEILNNEHLSHQILGAENYIGLLGKPFAKMFRKSQMKNAEKYKKKYYGFLKNR